LRSLETLAALDLPADTWAKLYAAVQNLTADDLARVAKKYLDPAHAQLVVLGDVSRFKSDLDALGIAEVQVRAGH
jgi:zinc protease